LIDVNQIIDLLLILSKLATSAQSGTIPFLVELTTSATARAAIACASTVDDWTRIKGAG
jgi:hypothetical protein